MIEEDWAQARDRAASEGTEMGLAPMEHSHWDWRNKVDSVEIGHHMLVVVDCAGELQGIMAILRAARRSRSSQEPILYVDFLEAAPWNLKLFSSVPKYLGIGTVLIADAVRLSLEMGFQGRIGLHSLPQAESFYKTRCQMTEYGPDPEYYDLNYFENTDQRPTEWLAAVGEEFP